jgi:hypothetical protein
MVSESFGADGQGRVFGLSSRPCFKRNDSETGSEPGNLFFESPDVIMRARKCRTCESLSHMTRLFTMKGDSKKLVQSCGDCLNSFRAFTAVLRLATTGGSFMSRQNRDARKQKKCDT